MQQSNDSGDASMVERLIAAMKTEYGDDGRRIAHALQVLEYAREILQREQADARVVIAAAILHDIGIREAERRHGSAAARYQELEGPPIASRIMTELEIDADTIEHVSRIVGSHHSANDIDTPEFRIVWDADWLVNLPAMYPDNEREPRRGMIASVFKTRTGQGIARRLFW